MGTKRKHSYRDIALYIEIALFLLCSGSCLGIVYARYLDIIFAAVSFAFLLQVSGKVRKKNTIVFLLFLSLYIFSYIVNRKYSPNMNAYISFALRMFGTYCLLSICERDDFETKYVNIMDILNVLGLIAFVLVLFTSLKDHLFNVGRYPLFGPFNFIKLHEGRNSGIFWEPGAYQLFLLYELLIIFKRANWTMPKKKDMKIAIVCILCLLTTRSTTGYLLLGGFIAYYLIKNWSELSTRNKLIGLLPIVILIMGGAFFLFNTSVVQDKLTTNNISYALRMNDLRSSFNLLITQHPMFGFGYESTMVSYLNDSRSIYHNSVGILAEMLSVGIVFILTFTYIMLKNSGEEYRKEKWILWLILIVACFTEDFYMYPIFFMWLFSFKTVRINTLNKSTEVKQNARLETSL